MAGLLALRTPAERRAARACLVEGELLLAEALDAGLRPRVVAVSAALAEHAVLARAAALGAAVVLLPQRLAERVSDREHAPGLLAEVPQPGAWDGALDARGPALVLVLCGLQDPGNVGTLLRSARAFGAAACLVTPGTADPFGPKVVRAAAGASFRLPVAGVEPGELAALAQRLALQPVAAVPPAPEPTPEPGREAAAHAVSPRSGPPATAPADGTLPARCLLLLGHETRGLPELPGAARACVAQEASVDSLNVAVAGSILMAGWYRAQRAAPRA